MPIDWIPVSERLPELDDAVGWEWPTVLVYCNTVRANRYYRVGYYSPEEAKWWSLPEENEVLDVTHWAELTRPEDET